MSIKYTHQGCTRHSGCECRWEKERGSAFFDFGKETEDFYPTRALGTGPARVNEMLPLPSAYAHEKRLSIKAGILELWDSTVPVISGTSADTVCSFSLSAG